MSKRENHGMKHTKLYYRWARMKTRCLNKNVSSYKYYGGRGITVCDEWCNSFMAFYTWAMANGYRNDLDLDRRDNNKGYSPSNCRFVTRTVNNNNKRSPSHKGVTINGETRTLAEWSEISGISEGTLYHRVHCNLNTDILGPTKKNVEHGITINGETKTLTEWSEISGISKITLYSRLNYSLNTDVFRPVIKR